MDRRSGLEQQHRSGSIDVSREKAALRRSNSLSVRLSRSIAQPDHAQAAAVMEASSNAQQLESLQQEINTVVQQQEEVLVMLKRRGGIFRGLSDRLKSAIRGGEQETVELRHRLQWLRKKEGQLREEKLIRLIKDVSGQPSLQAPGAVAAAVAAVTSASPEVDDVDATKPAPAPTGSKKRSGFRRSVSSAGGYGDKKASNAELTRQSVGGRAASSRRHSFGRGAADDPAPALPEHRPDHIGEEQQPPSRAVAAANKRHSLPVSAAADRPHISTFQRAHMMAAGGEAYLELSEEHQKQRRFHSSGGIPATQPVWRRPDVPRAYAVPSADLKTAAPGTVLLTSGLAAPPAAAVASGNNADPTATARTMPFSPGTASTTTHGDSPPRLTRTRASTARERENIVSIMPAAGGVGMTRRHIEDQSPAAVSKRSGTSRSGGGAGGGEGRAKVPSTSARERERSASMPTAGGVSMMRGDVEEQLPAAVSKRIGSGRGNGDGGTREPSTSARKRESIASMPTAGGVSMKRSEVEDQLPDAVSQRSGSSGDGGGRASEPSSSARERESNASMPTAGGVDMKRSEVEDQLPDAVSQRSGSSGGGGRARVPPSSARESESNASMPTAGGVDMMRGKVEDQLPDAVSPRSGSSGGGGRARVPPSSARERESNASMPPATGGAKISKSDDEEPPPDAVSQRSGGGSGGGGSGSAGRSGGGGATVPSTSARERNSRVSLPRVGGLAIMRGHVEEQRPDAVSQPSGGGGGGEARVPSTSARARESKPSIPSAGGADTTKSDGGRARELSATSTPSSLRGQSVEGSNAESGDGGSVEKLSSPGPALVSFSAEVELLPPSPLPSEGTTSTVSDDEDEDEEDEENSARPPATTAEARLALAKAKAALLRGLSSSSFDQPPCGMEPLARSPDRNPSPPLVGEAGSPEVPPTSSVEFVEDNGVLAVPGAGAASSSAPPDSAAAAGSEPGMTAGEEESAASLLEGEAAAVDMPPPPTYAELNPPDVVPVANVGSPAVGGTRELVSTVTTTTAVSTSAVAATSEAQAPAPVVAARPPPPQPYRHLHGKHPLASIRDLLSSCFAFVDATDGNSSLPEYLRKEMKLKAIATARKAEVAEAVKMETPPSLWVSQYEDMSKKYGLGFVLSDGSSGVAFKDGTKIALDASCSVFEYLETGRGDTGSESDEKSDPSQATASAAVVAGGGAGAQAGPGAAGKRKLVRQTSRHYGRSDSRSGSGGEVQQRKQMEKQRPLEPFVYPVGEYPARFQKKVTIAIKVRELLERAAAEEDSACGSAVAAPIGGAMTSMISPAMVAGKLGGGFGKRTQPFKASGEPLVFIDDWKRTRSSWVFWLSNRTLQVVFLDATEILLSEEARLITFVNKGGYRETMALLRVLEEERLDVIVRVRECHSLVKKIIAHDESKNFSMWRQK